MKGIFTAARTASKIFPIAGRSRSRPDPPLHFTTFFAGQPRFRSTRSKPKSFDHARRLRHHLRIAAKQLRRDRMLVFVEMQIALGLLIFVREARRRPR